MQNPSTMLNSAPATAGRGRRFLVPLLAIAVAGTTGEVYQRVGSEYVRYEGTGPGLDSSRVVVGGWPLPFLLDKPYLSPVGSVSLTEGLIGDDIFRPGSFFADALLFYLVGSVVWRLTRWLRNSGKPAVPSLESDQSR
jgi:hypothetical protein